MCVALAGCAVTYPSRSVDSAYLMAPNGLDYADGTQTLADAENTTILIKLARFVRDPETEQTRVVISDEIAVLPEGFTSFADAGLTISLDGETLNFANVVAGENVVGITTLESGQSIWSYLNFAMANSGTGGIYTYQKFSPILGGDAIDTEGFFTIGFQTSPEDIASLTGDATYSGFYFGYGQLLEADGGLLNDELETNGAVTIEVDFNRARVSGQLNGSFDPDGDDTSYSMIFIDAAIDGNSFAAAPDMICQAGATCTSATSLGASFFGDEGAEISGVIGFDETTELSETTTRFVGAAGFSSTRHPADITPSVTE